jgi:hypothetical protein
MESNEHDKEAREPHRVRLPGFITNNNDEIGLGDVVKRAAYVQPWVRCERRATALNRWMLFTR